MEMRPETKPEAKPEAKPETEPKPEPDAKPETKSETNSETKPMGRAFYLMNLAVSDEMLPDLVKDPDFKPGLHGTDILRKCIKLGYKQTSDDMIDVMRKDTLENILKFYGDMKFEVEEMIKFCPKDIEVLRWLYKNELIGEKHIVFQYAAVEGYIDCALYIVKRGIGITKKDALTMLKSFPTAYTDQLIKLISAS